MLWQSSSLEGEAEEELVLVAEAEEVVELVDVSVAEADFDSRQLLVQKVFLAEAE